MSRAKYGMRNWIDLFEQNLKPAIRVEHGMVIARLNNRDVAWYEIVPSGDTVSLHANVDASVRRKGISTAVYDWAEEYFAEQGQRLVPFSRLSPEAHAMWAKRAPGSVDDYHRDGDNWYR